MPPFRTKFNQIGRFQIEADDPFAWAKDRPTYGHHMGLERSKECKSDLFNLERACSVLQIPLPSKFLLFMKLPQLWTKFRSANGGFFDIRELPARCPVSRGFLIPFISDQQYCHFYFLHILPEQSEYEVVWADDLYHGAIYASQEEFENEYKKDFDKNAIYLCDNDFEHFMRCHYENHEKWLTAHGF